MPLIGSKIGVGFVHSFNSCLPIADKTVLGAWNALVNKTKRPWDLAFQWGSETAIYQTSHFTAGGRWEAPERKKDSSAKVWGVQGQVRLYF